MAGEGALRGRVAIVTGASSGIGAAGAVRLAEAGAAVVLAARRADRLAAVAARIMDRGGRAIVAAGDVTREQDRLALVERARAVTGRIDILVNNAGYGSAGAIEELSPAELRAHFETNFFAAVRLMQLVIPEMRARGDGRIVNMSSIAGRLAMPGLAAYAATKHALEAISDAARIELRPFGVRVAVLEPGTIKTEIWSVGRALAGERIDAPSPYRRIYDALLRWADRAERTGADPDVVARAMLHAAASPRPKARYVMPLDGVISVALAHVPAPLRDRIVMLTLDPPARVRLGRPKEPDWIA